MKKILSLFVLLMLFSASTLAYELQGDSIVQDAILGSLKVTPHTATGVDTFTQYVEITNNLVSESDFNIGFVFDENKLNYAEVYTQSEVVKNGSSTIDWVKVPLNIEKLNSEDTYKLQSNIDASNTQRFKIIYSPKTADGKWTLKAWTNDKEVILDPWWDSYSLYFYDQFDNLTTTSNNCPINGWYQNQALIRCDTANTFGIWENPSATNKTIAGNRSDGSIAVFHHEISSTSGPWSMELDITTINSSTANGCGFYTGGNSDSTYYANMVSLQDGEMKWYNNSLGWQSFQTRIILDNNVTGHWKIISDAGTDKFDIYFNGLLVQDDASSRLGLSSYDNILLNGAVNKCYLDNVCVYNGTSLPDGNYCGQEGISEEDARTAIVNGIQDAVPSATIYTDQQVYTRNSAGTQDTGTFDKVAVYGNQRWSFNYITSGESAENMANLGNRVYFWENQSLTTSDVRQHVANLINETIL